MIATSYKYMKNTGATPRFEEAFAFKHILNAVDSANEGFLAEERALKRGKRVDDVTNTARAYTQAMNRFNTPGVSAAYDTILEPVVAEPRPKRIKNTRSGAVSYQLEVQRGWKFKRVENNRSAPNFTKYEAELVAVFSTPRVANLSCMEAGGVVNHWDQDQNQAWFG